MKDIEQNTFWLSLFVAIILGVVSISVSIGHYTNINSINGRKETNKCYETLKDKSAGDLRITCGIIT